MLSISIWKRSQKDWQNIEVSDSATCISSHNNSKKNIITNNDNNRIDNNQCKICDSNSNNNLNDTLKEENVTKVNKFFVWLLNNNFRELNVRRILQLKCHENLKLGGTEMKVKCV